jgi:GNAT superfamily N-acetyltransferase
MDLPLGWHTDLAVLRLEGSTIEDRGDHVVVRTPMSPLYYWGNFVLVTDPGRVDEPAHWLEVFAHEHPDAAHRSIGLVAQPRDEKAWVALDLELDHDDVLAATTCPEPTPPPQGYVVKQIADTIEWEQSTGMRIEEFAEGDRREAEHERNRTESRRDMSDQGHVAWFGAFHGDRLAAELGIVDCGGGVARYQSVVTAAEHRRRGLAGHLLGVAAQWAAERGVRRWVIVAEADSDASRLYRSRGFAPADRGFRALRKPASADEKP